MKQDVSQSIIMNQSKNMLNSRMYAGGNKPTDMTNESAFPNTTYEELHFTMNKQGDATQPYNNTTVVNQSAMNGGGTSDLHKLHLLQTLQSLQYIKQVEKPTDQEINKKTVYLP